MPKVLINDNSQQMSALKGDLPMLRNIFTNRLFIGVCVLLICGVVSVYFLRTDISDEPTKIYTPVEPLSKPTEQPKVEVPVGDTSRGGHFHADGTWHAEPHGTPVEPPQKTSPHQNVDPLRLWEDLSEAEKAQYTPEQREGWIKKRMRPAPPGYKYVTLENGSTILYKMNEPYFTVSWSEGYGNTHQLSDEEYKRYQALLMIAQQTRLVIEQKDMPAFFAGTLNLKDTIKFPDDVAALAKQWQAELWEKTWGPRPDIGGFTHYNRPITSEDVEREKHLWEEKRESLQPKDLRGKQNVNHGYIEAVLAELKAELQRR